MKIQGEYFSPFVNCDTGNIYPTESLTIIRTLFSWCNKRLFAVKLNRIRSLITASQV